MEICLQSRQRMIMMIGVMINVTVSFIETLLFCFQCIFPSASCVFESLNESFMTLVRLLHLSFVAGFMITDIHKLDFPLNT